MEEPLPVQRLSRELQMFGVTFGNDAVAEF